MENDINNFLKTIRKNNFDILLSSDSRAKEELLKEIYLMKYSNQVSLNLIYGEIGNEIRENKINFEKLFMEIRLLNIIYSKLNDKEYIITELNCLLPLFEILYKNQEKNKTNEYTLILKELNEILKKICLNQNSIFFIQNNYFFQIFELFIEKYDNEQKEIILEFISLIIKEINKINQNGNYNNLLNFIFNKNIFEIIYKKDEEGINKLFENNTLNEELLYKITLITKYYDIEFLIEKYNQIFNQLGEFELIEKNTHFNLDSFYNLLERNYELLTEQKIKIEKENLNNVFDNINNNIKIQYFEYPIKNLIKIIYKGSKEFNLDIKKINENLIKILIDKLKENSNIYNNIEDLSFLYLMSFYYYNNNVDEIIINKIKELKERNDYFNYLENRKRYKKIKRNLFSWNNPYSDFDTFYKKNTNNLKFKIYYFLSKEMILPLLKPILNLNSYIPKLQKFDYKNIFYESNNIEKLYTVDLNTFPFLEEKIPKNENYKCCFLKITNHIYGNIYFLKKSFLFIQTFPSENEKSNYDIYCSIKKSCYGCLIKDKIENGYFNKINYNDINLILKRKYYYLERGCEIFTNKNKSYYFIFEKEEILDKFYKELNNLIKNKLNTNITDYQNLWKEKKISNLEYLMWLNIFSNRSFRDITQYPVFPWLLQFYDLKNNTLEKVEYRDFKLPMGMMELTDKGKNRKNNYLEKYKLSHENLKLKPLNNNFFNKIKQKIFQNEDKNNELNKIKNYISIPYIYGSHFSNYAYISHYLVRLFPFTLTAIEIQGDKFDAPDRLFININRSFISSASEVSDLRELIPELFYLPEMFINLNKLNLGKLQKSKKDNSTYQIFIKLLNKNDNDDIYVNDVLLPCENNPYKFICEHRKKLEESNDIDNWIDLFFGKYAIYDNAKEHNNLYNSYCYEEIIYNRIKEKNISEELINYAYSLFDLGFNPIPVLKHSNGKRNFFTSDQLNEEKDIISFMKKKKEIKEEYDKLINIIKNNSIKVNNSKYEIYGNEKGFLFFLSFDNNEFTYKYFYNNTNQIKDININDNLNIFAVISKDYFINIFSIPECELINSIFIQDKIEENIIDKIFISSFPLPSIIIFSAKKFYSYSINGKYLAKYVLKQNENLYKIKSSKKFYDYILIEGKDKLNLPFFDIETKFFSFLK